MLPTSVVGSYSSPGWLIAGLAATTRGDFGTADTSEMLDDAVDMALRDQTEAGIDLITDGEMRRMGFFTADFYTHMAGVRPLPSDRKQGPPGHDQQHRFEVLEPITAPHGLGVVAEFRYTKAHTAKPIKVTLPGPYTLSGRLAPNSIYPDRLDAAWAMVPILNRELKALVEAGATFIQIDEPSTAVHPDAPIPFARLFNAALDGVHAKLAAHLCFGNYAGRPLAKRSYRPVIDQVLSFGVDQLVLEFANREMAELELCKEIAVHKEVAVGVIDVKNYYIETADDVAQRVHAALRYIPAEKLTLVPDCGFSQTARWAARAKLQALGAGVRQVRTELGLS